MADLGDSPRRTTPRGAIAAGVTVAAVGAVLAPWLRRLAYPNLIGDDVQRVIDLQTLSIGERLVRPFNEHLAPLFELVTAATWELAGHRLANVPIALTLASYLPYFLCLGMLWLLARREWGSRTIAGLAVVLFGASPIYAECVLWFSASTFTWALLFCLMALWLAGQARDRRSIPLGIGAAAACLVAPMGSAIGLLAGPVASIAAWPNRRPSRPFRSEGIALLPAFGTFLNLVGASYFRYHEVLSRGVRTYGDIPDGLARVVQAPLYLVMTGFGGVEDSQKVVPYAVSAGFFAGFFLLLAFRAARGGEADRRWPAIGCVLIVCGYTMIYCFRTALVGLDSLVTIQRYHLFPCLGLVLIALNFLAPLVKRIDGRPVAGAIALLGLAIVLVAVNGPVMAERRNFFRMQPPQRPVLAMMDRVSAVARSKGVSRDQLLRAFEPLEPRWTLAGWDALRMLPETGGPANPTIDDARSRSEILSGLSARDRTLLFADMNATDLLEAGSSDTRSAGAVSGQLVAAVRIHPTGRPGEYLADGWPSHLEFAFAPGEPTPRALGLPGLPPGKTLELWWAEADHPWSADRRVVVRIDGPDRVDRVLPLDRIPNLPAGSIRRIRITVRDRGPVAIGTPALLR